MKKLVFVLILVLISIGAMACSNQQSDITADTTQSSAAIQFSKISPEEAKKRLDSEKDIILLDVRTVEEYTESHIPGSILIPVDVIDKEAQEKIKDKDAVIFVYCRSGRRSEIAAESLVNQGYTKVYDLGGINDWPYETESGAPL